ncbi:ABC transporter ATP-binding protein [Candidatus Bipolaricaulota bacterium]|nr:ABC transporter ATP-binding protein [Candidatus Bipolaricaulota bacterium]
MPKTDTTEETDTGRTLLRAEGISKGFPGVWEHLILNEIDFDVKEGEVHTLLGENGAGKTVLANILSGFYGSTAGKIYIKGEEVELNSPQDGLEHGVGMIHQEVMLAKPFTVAENVALGTDDSDFSYPLDKVEHRVDQLSENYGLEVDPTARVGDLSAGEQQRAEILKVLYHEPQVLILDEPTSLLIPQEAQQLFKVLRGMADEGFGIVFITHKMEEVMEVSDRVTVLKLGKVMGETDIEETDEEELTEMMLDEKIPIRLERKEFEEQSVSLSVEDIYVTGSRGNTQLNGVSLNLHEGEIFGVAGVSGNGQSELIEAITGLREIDNGRLIIEGKDMTDASPREIQEKGVAHMPEKRREIGVVEPMTVGENLILRDYRDPPFSRLSVLNRSAITNHAEEIIEEFDVIAPDIWKSETRILSGGNIQRMILGRESWRAPEIIIASHPTHGLDRRAVSHTWELFIDLRDRGSAILLVSEDLDEVISLSDRIAVMLEGNVVGIVDSDEADKSELGMMMTGA